MGRCPRRILQIPDIPNMSHRALPMCSGNGDIVDYARERGPTTQQNPRHKTKEDLRENELDTQDQLSNRPAARNLSACTNDGTSDLHSVSMKEIASPLVIFPIRSRKRVCQGFIRFDWPNAGETWAKPQPE
jgi:hypothetical protein